MDDNDDDDDDDGDNDDDSEDGNTRLGGNVDTGRTAATEAVSSGDEEQATAVLVERTLAAAICIVNKERGARTEITSS